MYIGMTSNRRQVHIGEASPNKNVLVVGQSGTGKSVRITDIEEKLVSDGGTVLALDLDGSHPRCFKVPVNVISAKESGLAVNFFEGISKEESRERLVCNVTQIVEAISASTNLGAQQKGALREAILYAAQHANDYAEETEAIAGGLLKMGTERGRSVYNRLWTFLSCGVYRKNGKKLRSRTVNVISLEGFPLDLQRIIADCFLSLLWGKIRNNKGSDCRLTLILDEFQNFSLCKNSTLVEMLRECRKYGVNLLLATQTVQTFPKDTMATLSQCAVKLFFRQADVDARRTAKEINCTDVEHWILTLKSLKKGQSIAVGDLEIDGRKAPQRPFIVSSDFNVQDRTGKENCLLRLI